MRRPDQLRATNRAVLLAKLGMIVAVFTPIVSRRHQRPIARVPRRSG
jgi:hypothetical protein